MEEKFSLTCKNLKLGLIRFSPDMKLADKNTAADALFPFSSRGSTADGAFKEAILSLGCEKGAVKQVLLEKNGISRVAVAIREAGGAVLLVMHPVLCKSISLYGDKTVAKLLSLYSRSIHYILEIASKRKRINFIPVSPFKNGKDTDIYLPVFDAVNGLSGRLSETVLVGKLSVLLDNRCKTAVGKISSGGLDGAVSELLTLRELFGEKEKAELKITSEENHLIIVYEDEMASEAFACRHFPKLFEESLRLMGLGCYFDLKDDGKFTVKVFIPIYSGAQSRETFALKM